MGSLRFFRGVLGGLWGASGEPLTATWRLLGAFGGLFGASLGIAGGLGGHLGGGGPRDPFELPFCGPFWGSLGPLLAAWGQPWGDIGSLLGRPERSWTVLA